MKWLPLNFGVIFIVIMLASTYGWVMNIITLVGSSFDPLTGLVIVRVIGIFIAPLGAVMGYI